MEKLQRGRGGGAFSIQRFILQILDLYKGLFSAIFRREKLQYDFPKIWGGGGRRPFGIFLIIPAIWYRHTFLMLGPKCLLMLILCVSRKFSGISMLTFCLFTRLFVLILSDGDTYWLSSKPGVHTFSHVCFV